jgi:hypothetical protein
LAGLSHLELAAASVMASQLCSDGGEALLAQLRTARIRSREFTGQGFYTEFDVDRSLPPAQADPCVGGCVRTCVGPQAYELEFLLYVRAGYAEVIEAYSYGDGYGDIDLLTCEFTPPAAFPQ